MTNLMPALRAFSSTGSKAFSSFGTTPMIGTPLAIRSSMARERGRCPAIASTQRNPQEVARIVETLISDAIDALFIAGATDPDALGALCTSARLPHVFVDLPGANAPSVVTDNFRGAALLTRKILGALPRIAEAARAKPYFLGGAAPDYATARRVTAFRVAASDMGIAIADE